MEIKKVIALIIIALLTSFCLGWFMGMAATVKVVAEVADHFIEIDYEAVQAALWQYRNHINLMN